MRQAIRQIKSVKNPRIWFIGVILSSYFGLDMCVGVGSTLMPTDLLYTSFGSVVGLHFLQASLPPLVGPFWPCGKV
jgi:hypothetical protein